MVKANDCFRSYLDTISEEINDSLQEQGQVSLAELTKTYDLPGDFLSQTIRERLGGFDRPHVYITTPYYPNYLGQGLIVWIYKSRSSDNMKSEKF